MLLRDPQRAGMIETRKIAAILAADVVGFSKLAIMAELSNGRVTVR